MGDGLGREAGGGGSDREDAGRGSTAGDLKLYLIGVNWKHLAVQVLIQLMI